MVAAKVDNGANCGQSALATIAVPCGQAVETARPWMKSRVHVVAHLWESSAGRPVMQACLGISQLGIPKMTFGLESCKLASHEGHPLLISATSSR